MTLKFYTTFSLIFLQLITYARSTCRIPSVIIFFTLSTFLIDPLPIFSTKWRTPIQVQWILLQKKTQYNVITLSSANQDLKRVKNKLKFSTTKKNHTRKHTRNQKFIQITVHILNMFLAYRWGEKISLARKKKKEPRKRNMLIYLHHTYRKISAI